jgi:hypothetical protein
LQGDGNAARQAPYVKVPIAVLIAALLATTSAFAQSTAGIPVGSGPGRVPFGAGEQRGLQSVNNSGQNGFVTLFRRGARTAVVVAVDSARHPERIAIVRGNSCAAIGSTVAVRLSDLHHGVSRGYVPMTMDRLLSGNYLTVVYSNVRPLATPVSCGELYS